LGREIEIDVWKKWEFVYLGDKGGNGGALGKQVPSPFVRAHAVVSALL
jgi:hypothetical protein